MNGGDHKDSVRRFVSIQEILKRLAGEIERNLYAAEIVCVEAGDPICRETTCPFLQEPTRENPMDRCKLVEIRKLVDNLPVEYQQEDLP